MDIRPPFNVGISREKDQYVVTVEESGTTTETLYFSIEVEARGYRDSQVRRLTAKYRAIGR